MSPGNEIGIVCSLMNNYPINYYNTPLPREHIEMMLITLVWCCLGLVTEDDCSFDFNLT